MTYLHPAPPPYVSGTDPSKPCISTVGNVSRGVVSDLLNNRMHLSGADLKNRLRL